MPLATYKIAPMSAIYVGNYGEAVPMTRISAIGTGVLTVTETTPEQFLPGLQTTIQSGMHDINVTMTFYGDDELILRLSRGLNVSSTISDDPPEFNTYSLLLLHPDEDDKSSWYMPQVRVVHNTQLSYDKNSPTGLSLTFIWQDRNRYNRIYYQDTYDALAAIMGPISPI